MVRASIEGSCVACSRLSDSGEDAKVKGTRKVDGAGKNAKEGKEPPFLSPVSSRFIFYFALSQFRRPDYLGAWNRLVAAQILQLCLEKSSLDTATYLCQERKMRTCAVHVLY